MLLAMLPARLPVPKALPAMLEALLNLSHREKARVFMMSHKSEDGHEHPQHRLDIQSKPEEAAVGRVDGLGAWLAALKHPLRVSCLSIDLVPPAQTNKATSSDVLDVVEVGGEEEDSDDKNHDPVKLSVFCALREQVL
ncbi:hypothetical protein HG530_004760 [Fusarium avenaceum]|nr:hypothetical protein HG530_004760 [Fusarium avenaceum]